MIEWHFNSFVRELEHLDYDYDDEYSYEYNYDCNYAYAETHEGALYHAVAIVTTWSYE
jgi:hypothetical protein